LKLKNVVLRPTDDELVKGITEHSEYFDHVHALPIFQTLERSSDLKEELAAYRAFPEDDESEGHGHLLLRPIGQIVLAKAVGELVSAPHEMTLDKIFEAIGALDRNGRFEAHSPKNVWYGVTYDIKKKKMDVTASHRELAKELLIYLVRGAGKDEQTNLLREIISKRENDEGRWTTFSGKSVDVVRDADGQIETGKFSLPVPGL
jgi:hypothetical protein